nr:glycosyltransferase family 2 protein [Saprospiraceae bacterium]
MLSYITLYCIIQLQLSWKYKKKHGLPPPKVANIEEKNLPFVTIQLPIFNELYVVERLIDVVCAISYPISKLEIQVLDDSTDETTQLAHKKVSFYREEGFNITHIRRKDRKGFKAGALQYGLSLAKGEFIAIFDADFIPHPMFLKNTIPYFNRSKVGIVQTRWTHLNEFYSLITRLQAFQLNVHFSVEQTGRSTGGYFLQFNGTAGVWRRITITDAGGWKADTLTEDLDLSYRAQLKGWKITYLEQVESPAELPAEMNAFKAQQYRWMKGGAETAAKILPKLWRSDESIVNKFHGTVHLLGSTVFLFIFLSALLSLPAIYYIEIFNVNRIYLSVFFLGLLSLIAVYYIGNRLNPYYRGKKGIYGFITFVFLFITFLSLSMGMSLHNSLAVVHGYLGKRTAFIRTPKFNIEKSSDSFKKGNYTTNKIPLTTYFEAILALLFTGAVIYGIAIDQYALVIYHSLLAIGFATISYFSFRHFKWQQ